MMTVKILRSLLLVLVCPWSGMATTAAMAAVPGVTELPGGSARLSTARLAALLDARVANADVVAIGETVHGSDGMLRVQASLIRYLVQQQGHRLIVGETPPRRGLELTKWLDSCRGKPSAVPIDVLYFPVAAEREFWGWACGFNHAQPANPLVYRGMDVWDRPWEHYAQLGAAMPDCPAAHARSWEQVDDALLSLYRDSPFLSVPNYERCRLALEKLLVAARGRREWDVAESASTLLGWLGFHHFQFSDDVASWNERDRAQGRNLALAMARHGASRAILLAHTSHVSHNRSPADWWGSGDLKSGVHFFAAATGKRVFNIALTAFTASGAQGEWSLPTASNSMDKRLYDAGHEFAFFTSDATFLGEHARWWMQNQNFPGAYESGVQIVPRDHFDAYFFLRESRVGEVLPARPVWRP